MLTLLQLPDQAESSDRNRAFSALAQASQGRIHLKAYQDESSIAEVKGACLVDGRVFESSKATKPFLCDKEGHEFAFALPLALDPRIRCLKLAEREEDVIRLITPMEMSNLNGFSALLPLLQELANSELVWHWYILGRPGMESEFEALLVALEELGLEDAVTMVGEYSLELFLKLAVNMDFALFPATPPESEQTLIEALQMGLPVLCQASERLKVLVHGEERESLMLVRSWSEDSSEVLKTIQTSVGTEWTHRKAREFRGLKTWRDCAEELLALVERS